MLPFTPIETGIESDEVCPHVQERSPISLSLLGQPPSPSKSNTSHEGIDEPEPIQESKHGSDLGALIGRLCSSVDGQRPEDWILQERLDSKEAMMMDGEF
jgi:hypothetical protein